MSSITEEIKSRVNIADVIGSYLKLESAGINLKARCPFHNEKTPSFIISPSRQTYHCFGCNRGGDIFSFIEEIEGLDFPGALRILADKAGIELTREPKKEKNEREAIYHALELATKFYEAILQKFPRATLYLKERGLTDETIKQFRIGFAPDLWRSTSDVLAKKGVSELAMERAGLIVRSPKGIYDRFRRRIMFPITDSSGRVIAFTGRIFDEEGSKTSHISVNAKYLNSPETEIFHKSRVLFGLYQAREAIRRLDHAVIVEGQMDLILSHQAGIKNTVASSGTALTGDHLALIKRFTKNIVLAFDADEAGIAAAQKGIILAIAQDMSVRVVGLPHSMDPADIIKKDPEQWKESIRGAKHVIDFYLELLPSRYENKDALRTKISEIVIPFIAELKSMLDQGHFVGQVAKILQIKEEPIWEEVKKYNVGIIEHGQSNIGNNSGESPPPRSRLERIVRIIKGTLLWQENLPNPTITDFKRYHAKLEEFLNKKEQREFNPEDTDTLIFEAEARWQGTQSTLENELDKLLRNLEEEIIRIQFAETMERLKQAEKNNHLEEAQKLLIECQEISKKLHLLIHSSI